MSAGIGLLAMPPRVHRNERHKRGGTNTSGLYPLQGGSEYRGRQFPANRLVESAVRSYVLENWTRPILCYVIHR